MGYLTSQTMLPKHWTYPFQVSCVAMCSMFNLTLLAVLSTPFLATANILLAVRREDASGTGSGDLGQRTPGGTSKWRSKTKRCTSLLRKEKAALGFFYAPYFSAVFWSTRPPSAPIAMVEGRIKGCVIFLPAIFRLM